MPADHRRGFPPLPQICRQYEKPLVLQLCRLVRGFTHPASYFAGDGRGHRGDGGCAGENREDLALFSVDEFSAEMVRVPRRSTSWRRPSAESLGSQWSHFGIQRCKFKCEGGTA